MRCAPLPPPPSPVKLLLELEVRHPRHAPAGPLAEVDHAKRQAAREGVSLAVSEAVAARSPATGANSGGAE